MRLKYLELAGFKSFPKRIRIEFPEGICAIVGPNGCGKSNIVDAIRWVLGEQSPSVLRARSMEDLLYSGKGKSCNLAWVRLLIEEKDPSHSMFPPELAHLSEIEIERQLWKSGESKYLLNRKACRLRDIEYLFLDTGASRKSFAIIDQGKIGSIIEAGASQYKTLIEEIAGISRYRARRFQTQQKLFETSQNLERLKDIIREVELQAKKLKRQVKRCEDFLALKKEYEDIQISISWLRYKEQNCKLSSLYKKYEELKQQLIRLKEEKEALYKKLVSLDKEISNISYKLNSIRNKYLDLQKITSQKEIELNKLHSKIDILVNKFDELNNEIYKNQKTQKILNKKLIELTNKKENLIKKRGDLYLELEENNKKLNNISLSKIEILEDEIEQLKNRLVQVESYIAKFNREKEFILQQKKQLEIKKSKLLKRLNDISTNLEDFNNQKQKASSDLEKLNISLKEKENNLTKKETKLIKLKKLLTKYNLQKEETYLGYQKTDYRLKQLNSELENKENFLVGTKFLLANFRNSGIVADFIKVEKGGESFLELSLGRLLETVIFTNINELYKALEALKKHNYPECSIIFIEDFDRNISSFLVAYLYIDNKKKKISYHPQLRNFLNKKLNIVILPDESYLTVKDQDTSKFLYITKSKHIIIDHPHLITIISNYRDGILTKKLLIKELTIKKDIYQLKLNKLKYKITKIQNLINKKQKEISCLKNNNLYIKQNILQNKNIIELATSQIEIIKNKIEATKFEISEIDTQLNRFTLEDDRLNLSIKDNMILKEKLKADLELKKEEFSNIKKGYTKLQHINSILNIQIARLDENIKNTDYEINQINKSYKNMTEKLKHIEIKKHEINIEIKKLQELVNIEQNNLNNLKKQIQTYQNKISILEDKLDQNKKIFNQVDKEFKDKSNMLSTIEQRINKFEVEISKLTFKINETLTNVRQQFRIDLAKVTENDIKYFNQDLELLCNRINELKNRIDNFGPINLEANKQYQEIDNRLQSLYQQYKDLELSIANLKKAIVEIDNTCKKALLDTLCQINDQLSRIFPILFDGSSAQLRLQNDSDILDAQFELSIKIPGKRIKHIGLLSGGEKALASMAFVFSLYITKASPFCILDEIDAPLDQTNINKLNKLLELLSKKTQIILITHNQSVMEMADIIYGVTMEEPGISKVLCLPLKDLFLKEARYA